MGIYVAYWSWRETLSGVPGPYYDAFGNDHQSMLTHEILAADSELEVEANTRTRTISPTRPAGSLT